MARSRAVNLSGMLTSIGDTLGKMGDTGNQYVDSFRRLQAPKADMNDSASLLAYADWARRNGYDDEAKQYMALGYRQKEKETQEAKDAALGATMAEAGDIGARGQTLGAGGDLGGADATVAQLRKKLADPEVRKNPDAVRAIMQEISTLQQKRSEYVAANTDAIVQGVAQMDQQIATLSKEDPQYAVKKANYEAARAHFLSRPGVEQAYESQKLELMETNAAKMDALWKQQSPVILAEMRAAGTDVGELQNIQNKYPQFASQIIAVEGTMLDLAERRQEIRAADFKVENLGPRIEREIKEIEESDLPEPIKKRSIDLLNGASRSVEGGKIHPNSAIEAYDKARTQVDQLLTNEAAAQSGVIRDSEVRAEINYEKAQQTRITDTEVMETAVALYGKNPSEDELGQVKNDLTEELQNYRLRTAIAAGYEDPIRMDSDDKKAVTEGLREGAFGGPRDVAVMRATYDLVAEGYDREDVVNFLRKELPEKERKHAEAIFDDMWADVTAQDKVTAKPAEAETARLGYYGATSQPSPLGPQIIAWGKRAAEAVASKYRGHVGQYEGFLQRRSQVMHTQSREDYVQPLSQDYIYPAYRSLGG